MWKRKSHGVSNCRAGVKEEKREWRGLVCIEGVECGVLLLCKGWGDGGKESSAVL